MRLSVADEARRVVLPGGREVDLSRRKNVRLVLLALARARNDEPGVPLAGEALIEAGWPGERMRADAATKRLHTAIWTLRSLGLEDLLVSRDDGYLLDPEVPLDMS
jgi:DNA-binding SARP family transcriptional activator